MSDERRVAVVTGAARGIGRASAVRLAADGFDVAVSDLASQEQPAEEVIREIEDRGGTAIFVPADVSIRTDVFRAVDEAADRLGGFDVIVNNAGIAQVRPILDLTEVDLDAVFHVNVHSVVWGIQAATAKLRELGHGGTVISAGSIAGYKGAAVMSSYSASKFAVRGITQAAARELAPFGITVNAYAPGIVGTEMWEQIDRELGAATGRPSGESLQNELDTVALGRIETPEDVAGVVSFLAGPDAGYITGQLIVVDGGVIYD